MLGPTHALVGAAAALATERVLREFGLSSPLTDGPPTDLVLAAGAGVLGALLPDLDQPDARLYRLPEDWQDAVELRLHRITTRHRRGSWLWQLLHAVLGAALGALYLVQGLARRRGREGRDLARRHEHHGSPRQRSHWLLVGVGLSLAVAGVGHLAGGWTLLGAYVFVGYVSHLLLDMTTVRGVPALGPLYGGNLWLLPPGCCVRSGKYPGVEALFALVCLAGAVALLRL